MDIYFAGAQSPSSLQYIAQLGANKLFSYVNDMTGINEIIEWKKQGKFKGKLLVDSGAFSAYTKGTKVDLDAYIAWINKVHEWVDYFIALDIIPGEGVDNYDVAEGGYKNYKYMLERVVCPEKIWPVHHASDPDEFLYKILSTEIKPGVLVPYICLGGLVGTNASVLPFLQSMEHKIKLSNNPNVKVHALGVTSIPTMSSVEFTSCDSAAWIFTGATGSIMTPWGNLLVSDKATSDSNHILNLPPHRQKVYLDYLKNIGFTLDGVMTQYQERMNANIRYMFDSFSNMEHKKSRFRKKTSVVSITNNNKENTQFSIPEAQIQDAVVDMPKEENVKKTISESISNTVQSVELSEDVELNYIGYTPVPEGKLNVKVSEKPNVIMDETNYKTLYEDKCEECSKYKNRISTLEVALAQIMKDIIGVKNVIKNVFSGQEDNN